MRKPIPLGVMIAHDFFEAEDELLIHVLVSQAMRAADNSIDLNKTGNFSRIPIDACSFGLFCCRTEAERHSAVHDSKR